MAKIKIENDSFTCPMMGKTISERGEIMYATCAKCTFNTLHQIVDDNIYCSFSSSDSSTDSDDSVSTLSAKLTELENVVNNNIIDDIEQQKQINSNSTNIINVQTNMRWADY